MTGPVTREREDIASYVENYGFHMPAMDDALPFSEVERLVQHLLKSMAGFIRDGASAPQQVFCVRIVDTEHDEFHIFSTEAKRNAFADAEPRPCLLTDYIIDQPERGTARAQ